MHNDWGNMEGVDMAERILRAAIACRAKQVHFSTDYDGCTVFFFSENQIEFYDYLQPTSRDKLYKYLRGFAGIDEWEKPPVSGYGVFFQGETTYGVEVRVVTGSVDEDFLVVISGAG